MWCSVSDDKREEHVSEPVLKALRDRHALRTLTGLT